MLGLVLPMTAPPGVNWQKFRDLIRTEYSGLVVISGRFSADTGMKEIIISARKLGKDEGPDSRGIFVSLDAPPRSTLEGVCTGLAIRRTDILKLEDEMHGGTRIRIGDDEVGTAIDCPLDSDWSVVDVSNYVLSQIAYHIRHGRLYAPPSFAPADIRLVPLQNVADVGPSDLQIKGATPNPGCQPVIRGRLTPASTVPAASIQLFGTTTARRSSR